MPYTEFPVGAYFYPFTQTCPEVASRAKRIGYALVDETELVKQALPMFEGHDQPRTYCLGDPSITSWDNADSNAMGAQIELMQEAGLDFVVFDTYGGARDGRIIREYERPIEVFLGLEKARDNLGFAIMWSLDAPRVMLPVPAGEDVKKEPGRAYDVSAGTAHFIVDECVQKYWDKPGYLTIKDRPYLSLYNSVVSTTEQNDLFRNFASEIKEYAMEQYNTDPYLVAVNRGLRRVLADVIDGASGYALLPDFSGSSLQAYDELVAGCPDRWETVDSGISVPFVPPAVIAWDASPRCKPGQRIEDVTDKYPYTPIVTGSSPEKAAEMLKKTLDWVTERVPPAEQYGVICAWNEISEAATMLPRVVDGEADFSYLNAVAEVLRS